VSGAPARTLVRFPDDFTYLGAFLVPEFTSLFGETQFGRGLAFRRVAADVTEPRHLLSMAGGPSGSAQKWSVYEFRVATPEIHAASDPSSAYPLTTIVKDYVRQPFTTAAGEDLEVNSEQQGNNGIDIDPTDDTKLWWTCSSGYSSAGFFGYGILDYENETAVGHGRWILTSPLFKSTSGGFVAIPESFNTAHLGGTMRMGIGFGGGQSVLSIGDVSYGTSLTAFDPDFDEGTFPGESLTVLDLQSDGSTTVTSASDPFPASLQAGHKVYVFGTNDNGWNTANDIFSFTVVSRNSAGSITLSGNPTHGSPTTGAGRLFGSGTILTDREILVSYHPSTLTPDANHGRQDTHSGGVQRTSPDDPVDQWPVEKMTQSQNDDVMGLIWIDDDTHYGVISWGISASGYIVYLSAQVPGSNTDDWVASYDPANFAPASANEYYEIQPTYLDRIEWPTSDYTSAPYTLGPEKTVTLIESDSGKTVASLDGCVFTCPGHGFTSNNIEVTGSDVSFYNSLYGAIRIDDDHFYVTNASRAEENWPGTSSSNGGIVARHLPIGERDRVIDVKYDPVDKILYVAQQNKPGLGAHMLVLMFQKNP
jgi:hypothetical protein